MGTLGFDPHVLALDLLRESDLHLAGEWIKNGSRAYYDVGHFELSTCEVSNPTDLVTWEKAGETMHDTGLLNTRDEPHADARRWRRLHVIVGDALMNETAILLRHFVTSSILELMEKGMLADVPKLKSPVDDVWHNVETRDPGKWKVHLADDSVVSPIDVQRYYLGKIEGILDGDADKRAFRLFEEVLDGLESKSSKDLAHRIEWLDRWYAIQEATAA